VSAKTETEIESGVGREWMRMRRLTYVIRRTVSRGKDQTMAWTMFYPLLPQLGYHQGTALGADIPTVETAHTNTTAEVQEESLDCRVILAMNSTTSRDIEETGSRVEETTGFLPLIMNDLLTGSVKCFHPLLSSSELSIKLEFWTSLKPHVSQAAIAYL
jgi:hypothetical protein